MLSQNGLIGKVRLSSEMTEEEIMDEIRSVFATAMMIRISDLQSCKQLVGVASHLPSPQYLHPTSGQHQQWQGRMRKCRSTSLQRMSLRYCYCPQ